jgi:hypothetical protein
MKSEIRVGMMVKCLKYVSFMDGTIHHKNEFIVVSPGTEAYYNYFRSDYEIVSE